MKEGQTQEPVGGMKWEYVQILAKKHAEQIIEMGWRDNPDKDDIIADFISGYTSATPSAPIKTEGEDEWGKGWDSAITFANNLCVQISDDYNNADMVSQADTSTYCAQQIRKSYGDRSYKPEVIFPSPALPSPVGIDVEALARDYAKNNVSKVFSPNSLTDAYYDVSYNARIEGFKAGYAASQSIMDEEDIDDIRMAKELAADPEMTKMMKEINEMSQSSTEEAIGERKFTLKEALEIWNSGFTTCQKKDGTKTGYFKIKFGIDI